MVTPLLPMFPSCFSSTQPSSQATAKQQKVGFFKQVSFRSLTHFTPFLPRFLLFLEMGLHDRTIYLYRNQAEHPQNIHFLFMNRTEYKCSLVQKQNVLTPDCRKPSSAEEKSCWEYWTQASGELHSTSLLRRQSLFSLLYTHTAKSQTLTYLSVL